MADDRATEKLDQIDFNTVFDSLAETMVKNAKLDYTDSLGGKPTEADKAVHVFGSLLQPVSLALETGKENSTWAKDKIEKAVALALGLYAKDDPAEARDRLKKAWNGSRLQELMGDWSPFEGEKKDE